MAEDSATLPTSNDIAPERLAVSPEAFTDPDNHRFRKRYRKLLPEEEILADAIKDKANELADLISQIIDGTNRGSVANAVRREKAMAQTALEDCVMRAIRGVTA